MAPPHISPKKTPTGPRTKSVVSRSLWASSIKKSGYSQSSQTSFGDNTQITEQFRLIRESADDVSNRNSDDEITRRRKSYTRENKLAAINYATTTWKTQKDGTLKLISKYEAAKNLGIDLAMLRRWLKTSSVIENMSTGIRKNRPLNTGCQEPELERQLIELFKEKGEAGMKVDKRWIIRQVKHIYAVLYPHRIIRKAGKRDEYLGFKFSVGWFDNFRNRVGISPRAVTKKSQIVSENLRSTIESWLQFNQRNSQPLIGQFPQHGGGRYRLCDIGNMDQTPIAYEFLDGHTYDFKGAKTIWAKTHRSGWDKRQATLMVYVSADGINRCKPLLIFRGKDGIKNSRIKKEISQYHTGVSIQWNDTAWSNTTVMIRWLKYVLRDEIGSNIEENDGGEDNSGDSEMDEE